METSVETETNSGKLSQKDGVYNFICETLGGGPGCFPTVAEGTKLKDQVTKEVRKVVRQKLFTAVRSGDMKLSKSYDDSKLKKYCSGLINNWLKKDPRFN